MAIRRHMSIAHACRKGQAMKAAFSQVRSLDWKFVVVLAVPVGVTIAIGVLTLSQNRKIAEAAFIAAHSDKLEVSDPYRRMEYISGLEAFGGEGNRILQWHEDRTREEIEVIERKEQEREQARREADARFWKAVNERYRNTFVPQGPGRSYLIP